jgi:lipid II:glycine glycyltransferase (peptidoglycan interpeptide bridge formation enzyme)
MKRHQEIYRQLNLSNSIPIYLQSEWLDIVCVDGMKWDIVFSYDNQNNIQGYWTYVYKKQLFWNKITMPSFTPYMGPRLIYPQNLNEYERISFENKVLKELMDKLPSFAEIKFKWSRDYTNWLAFYWNKFRQQTSYTYLIQYTSDTNFLFNQFKKSIQRQIRKASESIKIRETDQVKGVMQMLQLSLGTSSKHLINEEILQKIHLFAHSKNQSCILEAVDANGKVIGAIYLIWDQQEMLYLYGGYDDQVNDSGAMPLLFWTALQKAHEMQLSFNFEGSMLPGVERFFRSYGAQLTPVSTIEKKSFPYKYIDLLR